MNTLFILFSLSVVGILETFYLIRKRHSDERPRCVAGKKCHIVLESKHKDLFGLHLDIMGLGFYLAIFSLMSLQITGFQVLDILYLKILICGAALFSVYLTYLQWKVIKHWCFWCLMSAFNTWAMAGVVLLF